MGTRYFQIELLGYGIANTAGAASYFNRSAKFINPYLFPGSVCYLEANYWNQDKTGFAVSLYDPSGAVIDTLSLPVTGGTNTNPYWTRARSATALTLTKVGAYHLELAAGNGNSPMVQNARLVVVQSTPRSQFPTVEHIALGTALPSIVDYGVGGPEIARTLSLTYAPTMSLTLTKYDEGGSAKFNFIWFKYVAAEWPDIDYWILETCATGPDSGTTAYAALYAVDPATSVQTVVSGSEVSHSNATTGVPSYGLSAHFSMSGQADGYYAARIKSSSASSFSAFYAFWLHAVMKSSAAGRIRGNNYLRCGIITKGMAKLLPTLSGVSYFEVCSFHNPGLSNTFIADNGTSDVGYGTEIAATDLDMNLAYTKIVQRSADVSASLPATHRFDGDDNGATTLVSHILNPFDISGNPLFYAWEPRWTFESAPLSSFSWEISPSSFGMENFKSVGINKITHVSTANLSLVYTIDGTAQTAITIAHSSGAYTQTIFRVPVYKGKLIKVRLSSSVEFRLDPRDSFIEVKDWASDSAYQKLRVFGDYSLVEG